MVPSCFWDLVALFCLAEGHRDPRTHSVQGLFVREGAFLSAPSGLFSHTLLFFPPFFFGLRGPLRWIACWHCCTANGMTNSESCSENPPNISERPPGQNPPPQPQRVSSFLFELGGNAVRFLSRNFFGDFPSSFGDFSEFYLS